MYIWLLHLIASVIDTCDQQSSQGPSLSQKTIVFWDHVVEPNLQADPALGPIVDEIDQVAQVAAEPVEFLRPQRLAPP